MCGIVGAVSTRNIVPILVQGLQRLEYRGYDSCGVAVYDDGLQRARSTSRVAELLEQIEHTGLHGTTGIAHTRWATHGAPVVHNAHPHFSHGPGADAAERPGRMALVHNGIIENHDELRAALQARGYRFVSQTDTEVIAHLIDSLYDGDLFDAVRQAVPQLHGAYAIAVFCKDEPHRVVGARAGSPLVLGVGPDGEGFLASDAMALTGVTDQIVYLEEGDLVDLPLGRYWLVGLDGRPVERAVRTVHAHSGAAELGPYRHYMQKEIFEQPRAIADTLEGVAGIVPELFDGQGGASAHRSFKTIDSVLILACGTSYYSGCVAKYWLESIAKIPTQVEVASEYRYRDSVPSPNQLIVTISQSGETADTLAALRHAEALGMEHTLTICNVATSAMVRECKLGYITRAGVEIGVASTKAFTTQLAGLFLLTLALAQAKERLTDEQEAAHLKAMRHLPAALSAVLALEPQVISWAADFARKEISYIHAEAYPAGELKHGPLALVTSSMPVVTVAPNDALLEKLKSNMQEVRARGGVLYVLPLQLLAYHTACARGTDVDKPRNLAKSVTVE